MDKKTFYNNISPLESVMKSNGFKRVKQGVYLSDDDFELRIVLDKWGWTEDVGWAFLLRLTELKCYIEADGIRNFTLSKDLNATLLIADGFLSLENYKSLFVNYPTIYNDTPEQSLWFQFYDTANLSGLIETIVTPVDVNIQSWLQERHNDKRTCPIIKRPSKQDIEGFNATMDNIFKDK